MGGRGRIHLGWFSSTPPSILCGNSSYTARTPVNKVSQQKAAWTKAPNIHLPVVVLSVLPTFVAILLWPLSWVIFSGSSTPSSFGCPTKFHELAQTTIIMSSMLIDDCISSWWWNLCSIALTLMLRPRNLIGFFPSRVRPSSAILEFRCFFFNPDFALSTLQGAWQTPGHQSVPVHRLSPLKY